MNCDRCLQEAAGVQATEETSSRFRKKVNADEDPPVAVSHKNVCARRKSKLKYIQVSVERDKTHTSIIDQVQMSETHVKDEPSVDVEVHHLFKEEDLENLPVVVKSSIPSSASASFQELSGAPVKDAPSIDAEVHHLFKEEDLENLPVVVKSSIPSSASVSFQEVSGAPVKDEPFIDAEVHHLFKEEDLEYLPMVVKSSIPSSASASFQELSGAPVKDAPSIDAEVHHLFKEEDLENLPVVVKSSIPSSASASFQELLNLDHPTESLGKGSTGLECRVRLKRMVLTESMSSSLKNHKSLDTGKTPFKYSPSNKTKLEKENRIHTVKKLYKCSKCFKSFNRSVSLESHMPEHGLHVKGEKTFKCTKCNQTYANPVLLKEHKRLHIGEKPYKCRQCNKAYAYLDALKTHKRLHKEKAL